MDLLEEADPSAVPADGRFFIVYNDGHVEGEFGLTAEETQDNIDNLLVNDPDVSAVVIPFGWILGPKDRSPKGPAAETVKMFVDMQQIALLEGATKLCRYLGKDPRKVMPAFLAGQDTEESYRGGGYL